jgi:hypothetical protein
MWLVAPKAARKLAGVLPQALRRWMTDDIEQLLCWKETDAATALGLKQS